MLFTKSIKESLDIQTKSQRLWWFEHTTYVLLYIYVLGTQIYISYLTGESPFKFISFILVCLLLSVCISLYKKDWRDYCLRYLFLPAINLAWIVLYSRASFDMIDISWNVSFEALHPTGLPQYFREVYDIVINYLPLFTLLRIHSFFNNEFIKKQSDITMGGKLWNIFGAYLILITWSSVYNPFETYLIDQNGFTSFVFYNFNLLFLVATSMLLNPNLGSDFGITFTRRRVPTIGIFASFLTIMLLVDLYGVTIFIRFPIATSCLFIMFVFVGILMREKWTAYIIVPTFAFSATSLAIIKLFLINANDYKVLVNGMRDINNFYYYNIAMGIFTACLMPLLMITINYYLLNKGAPSNTIAKTFNEKKVSKFFFIFTSFGAFFMTAFILLLDYLSDQVPILQGSYKFATYLTLGISLLTSFFFSRRLWPDMRS